MASFATMQTERVKIDQIVSEFFAKSSHIILESRIPFISTQSQSCGSDDTPPLSASPSGSRPTNRWFNLEMDNCSAVQESVDPWRRGVVQEPMVVDVLLQQPMGGGVEAPSFSGAAGQRIMKGSSPSRGATFSGGSWSGHDAESSSLQGGVSRTLLERWVLQYERRKRSSSGGLGLGSAKEGFGRSGSGHGKGASGMPEGGFPIAGGWQGGSPGIVSGGGGKAGGGPPMPVPPTHVVERPVVYKRTVIMLRSLYCTVRTLPAHRLFRLANSSSHSRSFSLSYAVSATPTPLTDAEKAAMMTCDLTPVETLWGRLCISVAYRNTTAVTALEVMPPILPRIISDYVGSPTTDPLRRFSSVGSMPSGGISGRRGVHVVSLPGSVPSSPSAGFGRRHSWSGGGNKVQAPPSIPRSSPFFRSASPSPSQPSDFHSSPPKPPLSFHHPSSPSAHAPSNLSPRNSPVTRNFSSHQPSSFHQTGNASQPITIHERRRSPPFSPSPSPSPPTPSHAQQDSRIRGSSAPVSIPRPSNVHPSAGASPRILTSEALQSRKPLPPPTPPSRYLEMLPQAAPCNSRPGSGQGSNLSSDGKVAARLSISMLAESSLHMSPPHPFHAHQVVGNEKGDEGPPSGVKRSLYGPPRLVLGGLRAISKTGSQSHEDTDDEEEFACPFAVDDEEEEYRSRIESPGSRPKAPDALDPIGQPGAVVGHPRFQDAAVGALVRILKSAPPLRQMSAPPGTFFDPPLSTPAVRPITGAMASGGQGGLIGFAGASGTGKLKGSPPKPAATGWNVPRGRSVDTPLGSGLTFSSPQSTVVGSPPMGMRLSGSKTAADALEELRGYREMRDFLLRQSGGNLVSAKPAVKPV